MSLFFRISNSPNADVWNPAVNADGTRVAFESKLDLKGENPDLSREIFLLDTDANPPVFGTYPYLSASRGVDLIDGAIAPDAPRTNAAEIELALGELE